MATKLVINCETGEQFEVELTAEEIAQREADAAAWVAEQAQREADEAAKIAAKESAIAKLSVLGLTLEEVQALIK